MKRPGGERHVRVTSRLRQDLDLRIYAADLVPCRVRQPEVAVYKGIARDGRVVHVRQTVVLESKGITELSQLYARVFSRVPRVVQVDLQFTKARQAMISNTLHQTSVVLLRGIKV